MSNNSSNIQPLVSDSKIIFLPENPERKGEGGLRKKTCLKYAREDSPLISIITVVFNGEKYLESAIRSVINQSYENFEYIIIDGGSSDRTLEIIQRYEDKIDYWVSEPDLGIYDAMNKGITISRGKIIGIINSDDWYTDRALEYVVNAYKSSSNNEYLVISGGICKLNDNKQIQWRISRDKKYVDSKIYWSMPVNHPATFVSRKLYETIGLFDFEFKISGDYDFIFRAYHTAETKFVFTDQPLAYMREGGVSNKFRHILTRASEHFKIKQAKIPLTINLIITLLWFSIEIFKYILFRILFANSWGTKLFLLYARLRHGKNPSM